MNWQVLWRKYPKWGIAAAIFLGSTLIFSLWWFNRGNEGGTALETIHAGTANTSTPNSTGEAPSVTAPLPTIEIDPDTMFIADGGLYRLSQSGEGEAINWQVEKVAGAEFGFARELSPRAEILYLEPHFVLADNFGYISFDKTGKRLGSLHTSDGLSIDGYVSSDASTAIFERNGDVWRGKIDWAQAQVIEEAQVTQTGYFTQNPFVKALKAGTANALLYLDPRQGLIWVNLETGAAESARLPATSTVSPDGKLVVGDIAGNPAQFFALDIESKEMRSFPIPMRIHQGGLVWLGNSRAMVATNWQVAVYDHGQNEFSTIYTGEERAGQIQPLTPSMNAIYGLINAPGRGIVAIKLSSGEQSLLPELPVTGLEWVGEDSLLMICDVPDTQYRGSWFYRVGSQAEPRRVMTQPLYSNLVKQPTQHPKLWFEAEQQILIKAPDASWLLIDTQSGNATPVEGASWKTLTRIRTP